MTIFSLKDVLKGKARRKVRLMTPPSDSLDTFDAQLLRLKEATLVRTDTALARLLGITPGGFSGARRRGKIPHKWLVFISIQHNTELEWLISGTGCMRKTQNAPINDAFTSANTAETANQSLKDVSENTGCAQCAELCKLLREERQKITELQNKFKDLEAKNKALKDEVAGAYKDTIQVYKHLHEAMDALNILQHQSAKGGDSPQESSIDVPNSALPAHFNGQYSK